MRHFLLCLLGFFGFLSFSSTAALATTSDRSSSCAHGAGRAIALCVTDTMKQWQREHYEYHLKQDQDHTAWHLEHDPKGVTAENAKAHRDEHERVNRRHNVFHDTQRQKERQLNTEADRKRLEAPKTSNVGRPPVTPARLSEGLQKCAHIKGVEYHRTCMKPYLRPRGR